MKYHDEEDSLKSPRTSQDESSSAGLLGDVDVSIERQQKKCSSWHPFLCTMIILQFIALCASIGYIWKTRSVVQTIWCECFTSSQLRIRIIDTRLLPTAPAQHLTSHKMFTSTPYFDNRSPYVSNDTEKVDKMWEDLYDGAYAKIYYVIIACLGSV